eukprot:51301-Chlamydomonas_euryale.AAC.5
MLAHIYTHVYARRVSLRGDSENTTGEISSGEAAVDAWLTSRSAALAITHAQIKSMDMEARQLPQTIAAPLLGKVREYKADLASLREQLRAASIASPVGDAARAELVRLAWLLFGEVWWGRWGHFRQRCCLGWAGEGSLVCVSGKVWWGVGGVPPRERPRRQCGDAACQCGDAAWAGPVGAMRFA